MPRFLKTIPLALLAVLLTHPCFAVLNQRAQAWKPQQVQGSARLSLSQIETIVRPKVGSKTLDASINDFVGLFEERFGEAPEIAFKGYPKNALYFELSDDGREGGAFTIQRERTRVVIRSVDPAGWSNALYVIAQKMLGARWYWAHDLGFEWVDPSQHFFSLRPWREAPGFVQRRFYPVNTDFGRRNRLNSVYSFNHNLAKVFSPELFELKPEVFAQVNGRRKKPLGSGGTDPQPDFTHPDAVEIAAQAALDYFEKNPEGTSFSLSINDNVLFDTTEATEAAVSPLRYFRRRPDYTDLVFGFMNQVAERVFEQAGAWQTPSGEDRYLTALAYYWTEPAPTIRIHPRVMPVLTSDRAQWHDPDYRAEDKVLIEAWVASGAERVATWDYYFGAPYPYPRQFNQWISESLRFMSEAGVDVFYSQLPSFWGLDGAKAWLGAELLWNPQQNADALLDEYYTNFFGAAAEPMRAFYETAEQYRNRYEGQADWIKLYKDESSIALFRPETLAEMRGYLNKAEAKVGVSPLGGQSGGLNLTSSTAHATPDNAGIQSSPDITRFLARIHVASEAFRLTELYAAFDQSRRDLVSACLDMESAPMIKSRLETFKGADAAYLKYFDDYFSTSDYAPSRRHLELGQSNPQRLAESILNEVAGVFYSLSEDPKLRHQGSEVRNFLGPSLPQLKGWFLDYRPSEHFKVEASDTSKEADAGLRISGADMVSVFRTFPVVSNQQYRLHLNASWQVSLDNRVHLHVAWLDRNGRMLETEVPLRLPIEQRKEPVRIRLPFIAPNNAYDLRVRIVVSRQYPGDYLDINEIDFGALN